MKLPATRLVETAKVVFGPNGLDAKHGCVVPDRHETFSRRTADALCWTIRRDQIWKALLNRDELPFEVVVLRVGDDRSIRNVIAMIVFSHLAAQVGGATPRLDLA
jgi:hypothetical protein